MRLVCPNCAAQYEVDDSAIPEGGRDVQCSNCGHTWMQFPEGHETADRAGAALAEEDTAPEPSGETAAEAAPDEAEAVPDEEEQAADAATQDAAADAPDRGTRLSGRDREHRDAAAALAAALGMAPGDGKSDDEAPHDRGSGTPERRPVDQAVLDILREEAERESLETQTELGLSDEPAAPRTPPRETEHKESRTAVAPAPRRREPGESRRELLPDIEQINSSLRSASDSTRERPAASDVMIEEPETGRSSGHRAGFRVGFVLAGLIFLMLTVVYLRPVRVIEAAPDTAPFVTAFVEHVDTLRAGLASIVGTGLSNSGDEAEDDGA
ncbi:hypothetical protein DDZ14_10145 [Maritimibacter sp. 55A14]|uniref:zinc-ribbon domain-containing protein n=1 Tax=Maritimibacter sp. 55A14 TaxID=2174844 RepID=UPI000D60F613|nr:zinc-ribbon domain-containing protein [Maritimibacter sp. 55A14]PWE32415.1 hypothetical protein DDZ14_10145 [Maritimibacter sp. 55A14]